MNIKATNKNLCILLISKVADKMTALAIVAMTLFTNSAQAIVMNVQVLRKENANNSCYTYFRGIGAEHRDTNGFYTVLTIYPGIGSFVLIPSKFMEYTHTGDWGRRLDRADKLKHLIILATDQSAYVNGYNPLIISNKNTSRRKAYYLSKQPEWDIFLAKLIQESGYSDLSDASSDEETERNLRNLILRANKTGMLCTRDLMEKMVKENSFRPLRKIILDGQLADRVSKMEQILSLAKNGEKTAAEREKAQIEEEKEVMRLYFGLEAVEAPKSQKAVQARPSHPLLTMLYTKLQRMIEAIPPFQL